MAKKRKRLEEEKEKWVFVPPKFDVLEYLRNELKETKILLVTLLCAVIAGGCSLLFMKIFYPNVSTGAFIGFLFGLGMLGALRYIYPLFRIDLKAFNWKKWLVSGGTFFTCWLAVWILLSNPPVSDFTPPTIHHLQVWENQGGNTWIVLEPVGGTYLVSGSKTIRLNVTVTDNCKISKVVLNTYDKYLEFNSVDDKNYYVEFIPQVGKTVTVIAIDSAGNAAHYPIQF